MSALDDFIFGYRFIQKALTNIPKRGTVSFEGEVDVQDDSVLERTRVIVGVKDDAHLSVSRGLTSFTTPDATPVDTTIVLFAPPSAAADGLYSVDVTVRGTGADFTTNVGLFRATALLSVIDGVPTLLEAPTAAAAIPAATTLAAVVATDGATEIHVEVTGIAATVITWAIRFDVTRLVP